MTTLLYKIYVSPMNMLRARSRIKLFTVTDAAWISIALSLQVYNIWIKTNQYRYVDTTQVRDRDIQFPIRTAFFDSGDSYIVIVLPFAWREVDMIVTHRSNFIEEIPH